MPVVEPVAFGGPGSPPRWTASTKSGVGCAFSPASPLWFTLGSGILDEVYYPHLDRACIRDFGFLVTGPDGYFAEEKRDCDHSLAMAEPGVPAFRLVGKARDGRWQIEKRIVADPLRPCVLQKVRLSPGKSKTAKPFAGHALIAPHLVNAGAQNTAWVEMHKGRQILFASGHGTSLAVACSEPFTAASAGFVGASDGWQMLRRDGVLDPCFARAENGNVALTGSFDPSAGPVVFALAFGNTPEEAADTALASLGTGFDAAWSGTIANWQAWHANLAPLEGPVGGDASFRTSAQVLATHFGMKPRGATIASLSIPWGQSKGDNDLGGYHLVWPRDMCETAGGFLAMGNTESARAMLGYLRDTQLPDGSWAQNMWLDGEPYWRGIQLDETGFPILLAEHLHRLGLLAPLELATLFPMVRRAAAFLLCNGPVTGEDRWEENAGYSPFTLAVVIAALLAAADLFDANEEPDRAIHLRETADCWNEQIEAWTFAADKSTGQKGGIAGHYVRIAAPGVTDRVSPDDDVIPILNRDAADSALPEAQVISPDALALVRFGLRAADDPRIVATVKAIDAALKADLPQGPVWRRYNGDGYGEHADGAPFDGTGIGRAWPLLTGERAHYELAAGRPKVARALLATLEGSAGPGGMLPEQVWDSPDIPERWLFRGRPSGSAMPLVWTHSEHVKLIRSIADGAIFDQPPQTVARYVRGKTVSSLRLWRFNNRITRIPRGKRLRVEVMASAMIHWGVNGWQDVQDVDTTQSAFSTYYVDLPVDELPAGTTVQFTFYWHGTGCWEEADYSVEIVAA